MQRVLLIVALALGAAVTYVDSRPTWDDTGVTAGALFVISGVLGFLGPKRPWLWALALGVRGSVWRHGDPQVAVAEGLTRASFPARRVRRRLPQ
jgi:hypothetical protein